MRSITTKRGLLWAPRTLGILFALFLCVFALDVLDEGTSIVATLKALFFHLLPAAALLIAVALAWRWQWIGTLLFGGFGIWYLSTAWGVFPLSVYLVIAGPAILIATLYTISWLDAR